MKNAISYYYGINVKDIHQRDNQYIIINDDKTYVLELYENDPKYINDIYELSIMLNNYGIYCHNIIRNKDGNIITNINEKTYVLMNVKVDIKKEIDINSIVNYSFKIKPVDSLRVNDWRNLWMNKIDYFEYQINQLGLKYPLIRESSSYFIGVAENGIMLLNNYDNNDLYLSHRRLSYNSTYYDLYNPLNFVFDTRVRDITEYFKSLFITGKRTEIANYINTANLSDSELQLFFIRMLYPSFYFDEFDNIIRLDKDEQKINKIINKIDSYELLITELYQFISEKVNLPIIEWIKK